MLPDEDYLIAGLTDRSTGRAKQAGSMTFEGGFPDVWQVSPDGTELTRPADPFADLQQAVEQHVEDGQQIEQDLAQHAEDVLELRQTLETFGKAFPDKVAARTARLPSRNDPRPPEGGRIADMMKLRYPHGTPGGLSQDYPEPGIQRAEEAYWAEQAEALGLDPNDPEAQVPAYSERGKQIRRRRRACVEPVRQQVADLEERVEQHAAEREDLVRQVDQESELAVQLIDRFRGVEAGKTAVADGSNSEQGQGGGLAYEEQIHQFEYRLEKPPTKGLKVRTPNGPGKVREVDDLTAVVELDSGEPRLYRHDQLGYLEPRKASRLQRMASDEGRYTRAREAVGRWDDFMKALRAPYYRSGPPYSGDPLFGVDPAVNSRLQHLGDILAKYLSQMEGRSLYSPGPEPEEVDEAIRNLDALIAEHGATSAGKDVLAGLFEDHDVPTHGEAAIIAAYPGVRS